VLDTEIEEYEAVAELAKMCGESSRTDTDAGRFNLFARTIRLLRARASSAETVLDEKHAQIATLTTALAAARSERDEAVRALTAIRDWSVKTREEYRSGYVQMTVTPHGAMPYALHAERTFNGPIAVLLHVTAECNRVLKAAGAAVAAGEG
jgi:hypothetical protein